MDRSRTMPAQEEKKISSKQLEYAEPVQELKELFLKVGDVEETNQTDEPVGAMPCIARDPEAGTEKLDSYINSSEPSAMQTLAEFLQNAAGPISQEQAIEFVMQLCDQYQLSALKGSLNPRSVCLRHDSVSNTYLLYLLNETDQKGLPVYRAPELKRGQEADIRSDVYSLGAILYELLSNKNHSAAQDEKFQDDLAKWLAHSPSWNNTPTKLKQIIRGCLYDDPALRYSSPAHLKDVLQSYLRPHGDMPAALTTPPASGMRTGTILKMASAICGVVIMVFCWNSYNSITNNTEDPSRIRPPRTEMPASTAPLMAVGTYEGSVGYGFSRTPDPTTTTIWQNADGTLAGEYTLFEPSGSTTGSLIQTDVRDGQIVLQWTDKYGSGELFIEPKDGNRFSGFWTAGGLKQGSWDGVIK